MKRINQRLQYVRFSNKSGSHIGCFRYHPNNSPEHEDMKYKVYKALMNKRHSVLVEAIFTDGGRCDILDLNTGICYEIIHSEKPEDVKKKVEKYPLVFNIITIDADKEFKEDDLL